MNSFIDFIAEKIWNKYANVFQNLTLVFPNNRSAYYFRKAIGKLNKQPIFSPKIKSFNQFVADSTKKKTPDLLLQIDILYQCYCNRVKNSESFDQFFFWGEMILKDFALIDNYLVAPDKIFALIRQLNEIDEWSASFEEEELHIIKQYWAVFLQQNEEKKERFLATWKYLYDLYIDFNAKLDENGYSTVEKQKRVIAENILSSNKENHPFLLNIYKYNKKEIAPFIFCGFNHLSKSEEVIIKNIIQSTNGEIYWDYKPWMIDKKISHEAGNFLRKYRNDSFFKGYFTKNEEKNYHHTKFSGAIQVFNCPTQNNQVNLLKNILNNLFNVKKANPEDTVIILPNRMLLFSVIRAIPKLDTNINISLAFPLEHTPVFSLIRKLISLQERKKTTKKGVTYFHFESLLGILEHQLLKKVINNNKEVSVLIKEIIKKNLVFIGEKKWSKITNSFILEILKPIDNPYEIAQYLKKILSDLVLNIQRNTDKKTLLYAIEQMSFLENIFSQWHENKINYKQFLSLFIHLIRAKHIPFEGYPLQGLQIMGILETRNLNFKHLIVLNMNEDSWPPIKAQGSFIPFNLRRGFGLPTHDDESASYAYHFFRLLDRSQTATLIYHTTSDVFSKGEQSRFIRQIELEKMYPNFIHSKIEQNFNIIPARKLEGYLTMEQREILIDTTFSSSMLNTYLTCPLQFYFRYIEKIRPKLEVEDVFDARHLGNMFHQILEELYQPYIGKVLEESDFREINKRINNLVEKQHKSNFGKIEDFNYEGGNILIKDILLKKIKRMIQIDQQQQSLKLLALEKNIETSFLLKTENAENINIKIKGIIDRIDQTNGIIRILDYKTGKDDNLFSSIEQLFNSNQKRPKAVFQTFFYGFLFSKGENNNRPTSYGILNTQKIFSSNFSPYLMFKESRKPLKILSTIPPEFILSFEEQLGFLFDEIFDIKKCFEQTNEQMFCNYCEFKNICRKN